MVTRKGHRQSHHTFSIPNIENGSYTTIRHIFNAHYPSRPGKQDITTIREVKNLSPFNAQ